MALLFKFELAIMSAEVYDHLVQQLEEAGAGTPRAASTTSPMDVPTG